MRRIRFSRVRTIREERGSMSLAMAGLIFVGVVAILPLVFNLGTIWSIRRQSQNSSDAARLAAAESIALSQRPVAGLVGLCAAGNAANDCWALRCASR